MYGRKHQHFQHLLSLRSITKRKRKLNKYLCFSCLDDDVDERVYDDDDDDYDDEDDCKMSLFCKRTAKMLHEIVVSPFLYHQQSCNSFYNWLLNSLS